MVFPFDEPEPPPPDGYEDDLEDDEEYFDSQFAAFERLTYTQTQAAFLMGDIVVEDPLKVYTRPSTSTSFLILQYHSFPFNIIPSTSMPFLPLQ